MSKTIYDIVSEFEQVCTCLYESEESEDYVKVGDAYLTLSSLLLEIYPGLSLSLLRTSEVVMQDNECIDKLIIIRLKIIEVYLILSNRCFCNNEEGRYFCFYQAACKMYETVKDYLLQNHNTKYDEELSKMESLIKQFVIDKNYVRKINKSPKIITSKPILDIVEEIAIDEEVASVNQSPQEGSLMATGHYAENRYMPMSYSLKERDKIILVPTGILMGKLYRGEGKYHKVCKSSLYRMGMSPSERFWERLKMSQFSCLIHNYPITHIFENGLIFNNGKFRINRLYIDVEAIAQHYSIKTSLMDMTVDKWVAAFFATSRWDKTKGCYKPIKTNKKKGVFYQYKTDFIKTLGKEVRSIGLQPLARPEYQNGYVYRMGRHSELNHDKQMKKTFVIQDEYQNRLIYAYINRGNRLFPQEFAVDKIDEIIKTRRIHPDAYNFVISKYYRTTHQSVINSYMTEQKIELDDYIPHFLKEEIDHILEVWEKHDSVRILRRLQKPILFYDY